MKSILCVLLAFTLQAEPKSRIDRALASAKKENRRVLILWGAEKSEAFKTLEELLKKKDSDLRTKIRYEYDLVTVDTSDRDAIKDLVKKYEVSLPEDGTPSFTILSAAGIVVTQEKAESDPKKLLEFLTKHQVEPRTAEELLKGALKNAKDSKKRVFVVFGGPG